MQRKGKERKGKEREGRFAHLHAVTLQGHRWRLSQARRWKCPCLAAASVVRVPHRTLCLRNHRRTAMCPPVAASEHVSAHRSLARGDGGGRFAATASSLLSPFSRSSHALTHSRTGRCPMDAASLVVAKPLKGQPCRRAHLSTCRCPPPAATTHRRSSHGHPCARAHWRVASCPPAAAPSHVVASHGQPLALAH